MSDKKEITFDFNIIKNDLNDLLDFIENKIEREWVVKYKNIDAGKETLVPYIKIARNTYKTIMFICSDAKDNSSRELMFVLAVPPLTRMLFEILFSIVFLLDDFAGNINAFDKSFYKEQKGAINSLEEYYSDNPKWDNWFNTKKAGTKNFEIMLETLDILSDAEKKDYMQIPYFFNVSKIIKRLKNKSIDKSKFLKYLDDLHYRELSGLSHLQPTGIVELSPILLTLKDKDLDDELEYFRSKQVYLATAFILSILTEIELDFDYGIKSKIVYLWVMLNSGNELSEEIYNLRYQSLLNS